MSIVHSLKTVVDTARICVPTVIDATFSSMKPGVADARLAWWSRQVLEDVGIELVVHGRDNAGDGSEPLIVMSNHQSHLDVPVLFQSIPGKLRMVAKAELFRIPVFGGAMLAAGFIRIDRADPGKAIESLQANGGSLLAGGTRVWIAPEGTRSRTGALAPFKSGGFRMALDNKVRILPVAIQGTRAALPRGTASIKTGQRVEVSILPIVDPAAYGMERRKELSAEVRRRIASALGQEATS